MSASPLRARAQEKKPARIASLSLGTPASHGYLVDAFRSSLRELGYVEGRDVVYSYRWAEGRAERLPQLAAELAREHPDIILAATAVSTRAATQAAPSATILMAYGSDPVGNKLVESLAHPGGRITGLSNLGEGLVQKMMEQLHVMAPAAKRVAVLLNPTNMTEGKFSAEAEAAAGPLRLSIVKVEARASEDLQSAFETIARDRAQAMVVTPDPIFLTLRLKIVELATRAKIPAIYNQSEFVKAGGLMSYGADIAQAYRRAAVFADKILKGARPGDLPVEQPTRFELVINMQAAKSLGLSVPQALLLRADEVIH
jgi:putative tryptophan/tyrosine transport system substrate-binding protein